MDVQQHNASSVVYDPRGVVTVEAVPLAGRVADLKGLRLGVLDNTKWNAGALLRKTVARLQEEHALGAVNYYKKESFSKNCDPALLGEIIADSDVVLTAIGD